MKSFGINKLLGCAAALLLASVGITQASITFDDFNVGVGHFNQAPTFSGSTVGLQASSTATRITTNSPIEGAGQMRLQFNTNSVGAPNAIRVRLLSGGGTPANNTSFTTSSAEDGWIGVYLKTTNTGWNVQIWLEGASNNGGIPKNIVADGEWHLYEWNIDDTSGGADGWGSIAGIIGGVATVADGSHTIDSILFRNNLADTATNIIYMDFVAKSDSGSVSNLLSTPCLATSGVLVSGPLSANTNQVLVTGVASNATQVTVYQNTGAGGSMVAIGSKTNGLVTGNNFVTVSGLVKGAQAAATQTVAGQESCVPQTGLFVGGGANPSVRVALSVRETSSTGPVGASGNTSSANLHFLGAATLSGGAPIDAQIISPSTSWQTVTFDRGTVTNAGPTTVTGDISDGGGYNANDTVSVRVYAYKTIPETGVRLFSRGFAQSASKTSNDVFTVTWNWNTVADAEGYMLIRAWNSTGYTNGAIDVAGGVTTFSDANNSWGPEFTSATTPITPTDVQTNASVKWNGTAPAVGTTNELHGQWGILESIAFVIDNVDNTGPFDFYIDNITNGTNVFQTFENAISGATAYGFQPPTFSGTTSGSILTSPDVGAVSNRAADSGTKSFHVQYQWNGTNASKWLRLTTSGANGGNPLINLDQPLTFRLLMQPVDTAPPTPPAAPTLSANKVGTNVVLTWTGAHNLQGASAVTGSYTNVPNTSTNAANPTPSPYTNAFPESMKFFRLNN